ncbi:DNA polymerase III subunit delta [Candidatus Berkelbacteria bacterium]|nr:DNA polymerase III subunit delta [Candidatus Berkelbacteria bacterium]
MDHLYLIYGQDTFRSSQMLQAIARRYLAKHAGAEHIVLEGERLTLQELEAKLLSQPMFVAKKLVILKNVLLQSPTALQANITKKLGDIPDTTVTIFYEAGEPNRRLALFKKLNQPGQSNEYRLLTQHELINWMTRYAKELGSVIDEPTALILALWFGADTWRLHHELTKLSAVSDKITEGLVHRIVTPQLQTNIFALLDAIAAKQRSHTSDMLKNLVAAGQPILQIIAMIANALRNVLLVQDVVARNGTANQYAIARELALHPFVVTKAMAAAKRLTAAELRRQFKAVQRIDRHIKTGTIEPMIALELLVAELIK